MSFPVVAYRWQSHDSLILLAASTKKRMVRIGNLLTSLLPWIMKESCSRDLLLHEPAVYDFLSLGKESPTHGRLIQKRFLVSGKDIIRKLIL
jgi:hypothetical protein